MTRSDHISISQVAELLAHNGFDVQQPGSDTLKARDLETGVLYQAALEGHVLFMAVTLTTVPATSITAAVMHKMLSGENGISTSSFQLYDVAGGKTAITLNNCCTLQNMGEEDQDDVLSAAGYLKADVMAARELLGDLNTK